MKRCKHPAWRAVRTTTGFGVRCVACAFLLAWSLKLREARTTRRALNAANQAAAALDRRLASLGGPE